MKTYYQKHSTGSRFTHRQTSEWNWSKKLITQICAKTRSKPLIKHFSAVMPRYRMDMARPWILHIKKKKEKNIGYNTTQSNAYFKVSGYISFQYQYHSCCAKKTAGEINRLCHGCVEHRAFADIFPNQSFSSCVTHYPTWWVDHMCSTNLEPNYIHCRPYSPHAWDKSYQPHVDMCATNNFLLEL